MARLVFGPNFAPDAPAKSPILLPCSSPPGGRHFGDQLNVAMLQSLTGRPVRMVAIDEATHLCSGSLLDGFLRGRGQPALDETPLIVWGTGFATGSGGHPVRGVDACASDGPGEFRRPVRVHAVRGRLTLGRLRAMGVPVDGVALGDPALLVHLFLQPRSEAVNPSRRLRLGIVRNPFDMDRPIVAALLRRFPSARLWQAGVSSMGFLAWLKTCDVVLSSSLHALIAADALGIPNARMKLSRDADGGDWSFRDYYSAFGVEPAAFDHEQVQRLTEDDLASVCATHPIKLADVRRIADGRLGSCPFLLAPLDDERHDRSILSFPSLPDAAAIDIRSRKFA